MRPKLLRVFCCLVVACLSVGAQAQGPTATQRDFREIVKRATDAVFPAVVFVKCVREGHETGERKAFEVTGSGVIISPGGEVVTNWHVVDKAVSIRCQLADGRGFRARLVGSDQSTDIALLQLELGDEASTLPHAALGDSNNLAEGDFVMAMGAPWGLSRSVSIGIVSCARRYLDGGSEYSHWIQTDAAISPGNSGGPLVNTAGEVIGINTLGSMVGGDLGFTVPVETVRFVTDRLREFGDAGWSWTGLTLQPLRDFNRDMYFGGDRGVIVSAAEPHSPASLADLRPRDRIVSLNGETISAITEEDLPAVRRRFAVLPFDAPVSLEVERGGETLVVELTPTAKGRVVGEEFDAERWDATFKEINRFESPDLFYYRAAGVFVYAVEQPGNAMMSGLRSQDIVTRIGQTEIKSLEDLRAAYDAAIGAAGEKRLVATVLRSGATRQLVLDFSRDFSRE